MPSARSTWPSGTSGWSPAAPTSATWPATSTSRRFRDDPFTPVAERDPVADDVDVVIVGGGIAGVVAGAHLRKAGIERIRIVDQAGGIGGTWYWNRYPGVMCDVESYIYLPMLEELDYVPKQRYAFGEEIRQHLEAIADRYDLVSDALFHTGVTSAEWDEDAARWRVRTDRGDELTCRYYVLAVGILNLMKLPAIPGMEDFAGRSFHTARWDYEYTGGGPGEPLTELGDKVVGLIGTGATGIQCLPALADGGQARLRVPAHAVRGRRAGQPAHRAGLRGPVPARLAAGPDGQLPGRSCSGRPAEVDLVDDGWTHHYAAVHHPPRWKGMTVEEYMRGAEELDFGIMEEHRRRVDELVSDPATAEILKPYYRYLCKRPCFHDEYLQAFNSPNVTLVDCPAGIDRVTEQGPVVDGQQYEVDCLIYGTGFEPELTPLHRRAGHDDRRSGRHHPGREVGRRRRQPLRDDEPRVPEPVRHARARAAGRRHRQLHPARRARRRVRRRRRRHPRASGACRRSTSAPRPRRPGSRRSSTRSWTAAGHVGVHAVADQQRGQPGRR